MAVIAVNPFMMGDCIFAVAADNYEAHVSQVEFAPTSQTVPFKGLTPTASFTFGTNSTWVCNLGFAQDWATPASLSRYLFEHEGEEIDVVLTPKASEADTISATLIVTPGSIGGQVDTVAVSTVALGCKGRPVLSAAA